MKIMNCSSELLITLLSAMTNGLSWAIFAKLFIINTNAEIVRIYKLNRNASYERDLT